MITGDEFSIVSDLATVRSAKGVLRDVVPMCSSDCISKEEWQTVMQTLMKWEESLNELVQISDN